jgi:hypothetical protein
MFAARRAIAIAVLALPTSWLIACASADPGPASGNSDLTKGTSSGSAASPKKTDAGAEASAPKPSAATCGAKADLEACYDCCLGTSDPFKVSKTAYATCRTTAAQKCGTECVALYTDTSDGGAVSDLPVVDEDAPDPCVACQSDIDACDAVPDKACSADPNCAAALKCVNDAKCNDKTSEYEGGLPSDDPGPSGSSSSSSGGS